MNFSEILDFWFEGIDDGRVIDNRQMPFRKWFSGGADLDKEIRERFEAVWADARKGMYRDWEDTSKGRLALIILFDQFSRNMFRGTSKMFETDPLALALCRWGIQEESDQQLAMIERVFFYMPLMHNEDMDVQRISVESFERLFHEVREKRPENVSYYEGNLRYARQHCETIKRFGRFPYRNQLLQRVSTIEEEIFLTNKKNS